MTNILIVGLGGFIGAVARYCISTVVHRLSGHSFPYGTLTVNVLGCLLVGVLIATGEGRTGLHPNIKLFLTIGALGAFTTFSTFGHETVSLLRNGNLMAVLLNVSCNLVLGLGAVWLGRTLVRTALN